VRGQAHHHITPVVTTPATASSVTAAAIFALGVNIAGIPVRYQLKSRAQPQARPVSTEE
jgi:hypothetical protein